MVVKAQAASVKKLKEANLVQYVKLYLLVCFSKCTSNFDIIVNSCTLRIDIGVMSIVCLFSFHLNS